MHAYLGSSAIFQYLYHKIIKKIVSMMIFAWDNMIRDAIKSLCT